MAFSVEPKSLLPTVPVAGQVRARGRNLVPQTDLSKTQENAQAFVNGLSGDIREKNQRVPLRNDVRQDKSKETTQETDTQQDASAPSRVRYGQIAPSGTTKQGFYSGPAFVANLTLLQAQSSDDATIDFDAQNARYEISHQAYLKAGAQPGGEFSVRQESLKSAEQAEKIKIVPPVVSTVNFTA